MSRKWMGLVAVSLALVLCLGGTMVSAGAPLTGKLEIFSWWAGDEGPALQALIDMYGKLYPKVEVINSTVTGGSGVNARAVLKTRMLGGDPPGTFQVHAGAELIGTWVIAERMEDLTPIYVEEGWKTAFPVGLLKLLSTDKGIWSVPVNIHRSNVLWYVPENLKKWGVKVPATWDEFLEIAPALKAKGVVPLALGENWTANHLWECVALGCLGPEKWDALWKGKLSFKSQDVVNVWKTFGRVLEFTNKDAPSLSWQQATDMVVKGQAAFNVMGDWAAGYMATTLKLQPGTGFGWAAAPGTGGVFMMLSDSFGLPVGAPDRDNVVAWLKMIGGKAAQDTFNPLKGSVSARVDSDMSKYNAYLQSAAKDWRENTIAGSLVHGVVGGERFLNDFASVMEIFLTSRNPVAASNAAQVIATQVGLGR